MKTAFQNASGFHLIEILLTIAMAGIIAALSLPLYSQYMVQARRAEAAGMLARLAVAMEQFHIEHNSYAGATLSDLKFPDVIARNSYHLAIQQTSVGEYQLRAIPLGKQAQDDQRCAALILYSSAQKGVSGPGSVSECW
ncbi:Fimbrial protein [Aquicella siphonis]|uniref:Fimbrial protein n=1 Tax=Aquicella siphonis TaxID=254247 RepID=A0A5E4PF94_9COXI|nr:type IV pilin protein [Aquicella siphonis]VVC75285.1 Fimbrial protein [Aquicella siphonis]